MVYTDCSDIHAKRMHRGIKENFRTCSGINGRIVMAVVLASEFKATAADVKHRFQQVLSSRGGEKNICITHGFGCESGTQVSVAMAVIVAHMLRELNATVVVEHVSLKRSSIKCECPFSCGNAVDGETLAEWARDGMAALVIARRIWEAI